MLDESKSGFSMSRFERACADLKGDIARKRRAAEKKACSQRTDQALERFIAREYELEASAAREAEQLAAAERAHIRELEAAEDGHVYEEGTVLGDVERLTQTFRHERATAHGRRSLAAGREAEQLLGDGGDVLERVAELRSTERWHAGRARGQRHRFMDLFHCGDGRVEATCRGCGSVVHSAIGCSVVRICVICRDRRAQHRRARVWRARSEVMRSLGECGVFDRRRKGGRWSEKDFTLTIPDAHIQGDDAVGRRIELVLDSWRHFSRRMRSYLAERAVSPLPGVRVPAALRRRDGSVRAVWHRAFEWTPGADGMGHPHLHVWIVGPFLDENKIKSWWSEAMSSVGLSVSACELISPVVREIRTEYIVREVIKGDKAFKVRSLRVHEKSKDQGGGRPHHFSYIEGWHIDFKGKEGKEQLASADVQAAVYKALEGRRIVQASRGFLSLGARPCACRECGIIGFTINGILGSTFQAEVTTWRSDRWDSDANRATDGPIEDWGEIVPRVA